MEINQIATAGLIIIMAGLGLLLYDLSSTIKALNFVLSQLPRHLKEGTEVLTVDNTPIHPGDVKFHIPSSLFGDRDDDFRDLPPSLR